MSFSSDPAKLVTSINLPCDLRWGRESYICRPASLVNNLKKKKLYTSCFYSETTEQGQKIEKRAKLLYKNVYVRAHEGFQILGLLLNTNCPVFGASRDGMVSAMERVVWRFNVPSPWKMNIKGLKTILGALSTTQLSDPGSVKCFLLTLHTVILCSLYQWFHTAYHNLKRLSTGKYTY